MRSRHRSRALVWRLFVVLATVSALVYFRRRAIERNRDRYGPPPLEGLPVESIP